MVAHLVSSVSIPVCRKTSLLTEKAQLIPVYKDKVIFEPRVLLNNFLQMFEGRAPRFGRNCDSTVFVLQPIVSIGCMLPVNDSINASIKIFSRYLGML